MPIMRQMSRKEYPRLAYGALTQILPVMTPRRVGRFRAKLTPNGACLDWTGGTNGNGYGLVQGSVAYAGFSFLAHRVAWAIEHGCEPGDAVIRHSCDRPICCNPAHLLSGTALDNVHDAIERGRANFVGAAGKLGADANAARFSHEQRQEAARLRYVERWTQAEIVAWLGCHRATLTRWFAEHESCHA